MTQDPLENLQVFYEGCKQAPVPAIKEPIWKRLTIPLAGLAAGALAATLLVATPSAKLPDDATQAANAIRNAQYNSVMHSIYTTNLHTTKPTRITRGTKWTA